MRSLLSTWNFVLLFHICVSTCNETVQNGYSAVNFGYRCDKTFFSPETLQASIADYTAYVNHGFLNRKIESKFWLKIHMDSLLAELGEDQNVIWPLLGLEQNFLKLEDDTIHTHFLVLRKTDHTLVRVVQFYELDAKLVRCVKERDLSEMSPNKEAVGFRCPTDVVTFSNMHWASINSNKHKQSNSRPTRGEFPKEFDDYGSLFETNERLYQWPINRDGKFTFSAFTVIILGQRENIVGLVHKTGDTYLRCKLTTSEVIIPRFIGLTIKQQPEFTRSGVEDIFQCGSKSVGADSVLRSAAMAPYSFISKRRNVHMIYPKAIEGKSFGTLDQLFLWPYKIEKGRLRGPGYKSRGSRTIFLVIDNFSNVISMVYSHRQDIYLTCTRTFRMGTNKKSLPHGKKRKFEPNLDLHVNEVS